RRDLGGAAAPPRAELARRAPLADRAGRARGVEPRDPRPHTRAHAPRDGSLPRDPDGGASPRPGAGRPPVERRIDPGPDHGTRQTPRAGTPAPRRTLPPDRRPPGRELGPLPQAGAL